MSVSPGDGRQLTQDEVETRNLHLAAADGDLEAIRLLLAAGASPDKRGADGYSALIYAATYGHVEIVHLLLDAGADANTKSSEQGDTALLCASYGGYQDVVEALLRGGAKPDLRNASGSGPLDQAAKSGNADVVKLLLEFGANPNAADDRFSGRTALHTAAAVGRCEVVEALLRGGGAASLHSADLEGFTCLHQAASSEREGSQDVVKALVRHGAHIDVQVVQVQGRPAAARYAGCTALHLACNKGHAETLRVLLGLGACCSTQDAAGNTALHHAAAAGSRCGQSEQHLDCVRQLLSHKVDIDAQVHDGRTALHLASCRGDDGMLQVLLAGGPHGPPASLAVRDKADNTALHIAVKAGHIESLRELLLAEDLLAVEESCLAAAAGTAERGALVARQVDQRTRLYRALWYAANRGRVEMVEMLLNFRVRTGNHLDISTVCESTDLTPLHEAARLGLDTIVQLLLQRGAVPDVRCTLRASCTPLQCAAEGGHVSVIHLLLDAGAAVMGPPSAAGNQSPLCLASERGHVEAVGVLLEAHRAIAQSSNLEQSQTALGQSLHTAARQGNLEVVKQLLTAGAPAGYLHPDTGCNALHAAVHGGKVEIVKLLMDAPVDPTVQDKEGRLALHIVAEHGLEEMLQVLLSSMPPHAAELKTRAGDTALGLALQKGEASSLVAATLRRWAKRGRITPMKPAPAATKEALAMATAEAEAMAEALIAEVEQERLSPNAKSSKRRARASKSKTPPMNARSTPQAAPVDATVVRLPLMPDLSPLDVNEETDASSSAATSPAPSPVEQKPSLEEAESLASSSRPLSDSTEFSNRALVDAMNSGVLEMVCAALEEHGDVADDVEVVAAAKAMRNRLRERQRKERQRARRELEAHTTLSQALHDGSLQDLEAAIALAQRCKSTPSPQVGAQGGSAAQDLGAMLHTASQRVEELRTQENAAAKAAALDALEEDMLKAAVVEGSSGVGEEHAGNTLRDGNTETSCRQSSSEMRTGRIGECDAMLCVVCLSNVKDTALLPCKHLCACYNCSEVIATTQGRRCPVCRATVEDLMRLFL